jgi:50S ribosomal subunit-associated GTPase HflX
MPPLLLAVNKIDLQDDRAFTEDEIESKFGDYCSTTLFVSALSGEGVDSVFLYSAKQAFEFLKMRGETEKLKESKKGNCC